MKVEDLLKQQFYCEHQRAWLTPESCESRRNLEITSRIMETSLSICRRCKEWKKFQRENKRS